MEKYSYLIIDVVFLSPLIICSYACVRSDYKRYKRGLIGAFFLSILFFLLVDPLALMWRNWQYNPHKIIGIFLFYHTTIEEFIWGVILLTTLSVMVTFWADIIDKRKTVLDGFLELYEKIKGLIQ